jgi:hypothetical protein
MARGLRGRAQAVGHLFEPPPQLLAELSEQLEFADCPFAEVEVGGLLCENKQTVDGAVYVLISQRIVEYG